jgi:filamentous hemagglutinin family protein
MRVINLLFLTLPLGLWGQGENPTVVKGNATFEQPDSKTQVIRADDKAVINYTRFNLAADETARFIQPHHKASVLCRVTGNTPSTIAGQLEANGRLFFINPHGIFFSETAQIKVGSLVASTLNIKDEDFVQGKYRFIMDSSARESSIVNRGTITADGSVALLGAKLINQGLITAKAGRCSVGGELITLDFDGDGKISFAIDAPLVKGLIEEGGKTLTDGVVALSFGTAKAIIHNVVNVDGLEQASIIQNDGGVIRLLPENSIKAKKLEIEGAVAELSGEYNVQGKIEASAQKQIHWKEAKLAAKPKEGLLFQAENGKIIIDSPLGEDKSSSGKTTLIAKTIEQNSSLKALGPVSYQAKLLRLGGNVRAPNQNIVFDAPVVLTDDVRVSANIIGGVVFKSSLDAENPQCNLTIESADLGSVEFQGDIASKGPFNSLSVKTKDLVLHNIGSAVPGLDKLEIEAVHTVCEGSTYHTGQQQWNAEEMLVKNSQPTTFKTESRPLAFTSTILTAEGDASLTFETQGGDLQMPSIKGAHSPLVIVDAGRGQVVMSCTEEIGFVKVHGDNVYLQGNIQAEKVFIEAEHHITDALTTGKAMVCAQNEVVLRAKQGSIGSEERPINVEAKGTFSLGAKASAYVNSSESGRFLIYQKEYPAQMVYNGIPVEFQNYPTAASELLTDTNSEEQTKSLAPDLSHREPESYTDGASLAPRRAPIYVQVK